jgi:Ca2+-binding EF-hand superfamily protein
LNKAFKQHEGDTRVIVVIEALWPIQRGFGTVKKIAITAAFLFLVISMRESYAQNSLSSENSATVYLIQSLRSGITLDQYIRNLHQYLIKLDADRNGSLDLADAQIQKRVGQAIFRAEFVSHLMMADLDGDMVVTEDEIRQRVLYENNAYSAGPITPDPKDLRMRQELKNFADADTNHDGRVTWEEAAELARKLPDIPRPAPSFIFYSAVTQLLPLTPAGKSAVTFAEIEQAATELFRKVDTDNNNTISDDELKAMRANLNQPKR